MSYYDKHVFFCLNEREESDPRGCCAKHGSPRLQEYAKMRVKELGLAGAGRVRVNKAGCLDRCEHGPTIVVYPEGIWYSVVDEHDIDEIIQSHLIGGKIVERLRFE
jgi:(2Fe-2S) ferredoxin